MSNLGLYNIRSAFDSPNDEYLGLGKRPVVFDILGPDGRTSVLPDGLRMVLHVNPRTMQFQYSKKIERIQTMGGFVEQHWGDEPTQITFENTTGGFVRVFTGLTATTGPGPANNRVRPNSAQATWRDGSRRDTIAYDKFLDFLALYYNNGAVFDENGRIIYHGKIKCSFDGSSWIGYFESFSVSESAEKPYQFDLSASFIVDEERHVLRSSRSFPSDFVFTPGAGPAPTTSNVANASVQGDTPASQQGFIGRAGQALNNFFLGGGDTNG